MREEIIKYLTEDQKHDQEYAEYCADMLAKYDDIAREFLAWTKNHDYDQASTVEIDGWTAKRIHEENPKVDDMSVFITMYWLREDPDYVKDDLALHFITM